MKHQPIFPDYAAYPVANLRRARAQELAILRSRIKTWRNEHGWLMRKYRRGRVASSIREIRAIDANINSWRVS